MCDKIINKIIEGMFLDVKDLFLEAIYWRIETRGTRSVTVEAWNLTAQEGSEIKIIRLLINAGVINNGTVLTINFTQLHKTCECENH
jgi:hypothetical protein